MPQPQKISATAARNNFADIVNQAAYSKQEFLITRHDEVMAKIVPAEIQGGKDQTEDKAGVEAQAESLSADREEDKEFVQQEQPLEEKEVTQQQQEQVEDSHQSDQQQESDASVQDQQDASQDSIQEDTAQQGTAQDGSSLQREDQDTAQNIAVQRPKRIDLTVKATRIEPAEVLEPQPKPGTQLSAQQSGTDQRDSLKQADQHSDAGQAAQPAGQNNTLKQEQAEMSKQDLGEMTEQERRLAEIKQRILNIYRG